MMTVKEFSRKFNVPISRVKTALDLGKSRSNGGAGSKTESNMSFDEVLIFRKVCGYLFDDMETCLKKASQDNTLIRELFRKAMMQD